MDPHKPAERSELALVLLLAFALFALTGLLHGQLGAPPEPGDGPDYDSLAVQLERGHGFRFDWDDPEFRRPYAEANEDGRFDYLLERHDGAPTTYRPPLLPAMMALSFELFGRRFEPIRLMGCAAMAGACAIGFALVRRHSGRAAAWASLVLFAGLDPRASSVALQVLTESWACLAVALLAAACLHFAERPSARRAAAVGAVLGGAVYARTAFAIWIPLLLVIGLAAMPSVRPGGVRMRRAPVVMAFLATALVLPLPWMIRNCVVLGEFAPLGTQGVINLAGGYGDEALARGGVWSPPAIYAPLAREGLRGLALERAKAKRSREFVLAWIRAHPAQLPGLAAAKAWDLWRPVGGFATLTLAAAVAGLALRRAPRERAVLLAFAAANTIAVSLTWSAGPRYLFPLLPVLQVAAGRGFGAVFARATLARRIGSIAAA